jgi:C-1 hydroxylase
LDTALTERKQLQRAYLEAWNSHDPDAVVGFFTPDAVYDDRGAGEIATGRAAIRAHVAGVLTAFPDLRFEIVRTAVGEGLVCGEWRAQMTHRGDFSGLAATGRRAESAGVDVATLDADDKVTHLVSYYDGAAIMRDFGLLPARGSRLEKVLLRAASVLSRRS